MAKRTILMLLIAGSVMGCTAGRKRAFEAKVDTDPKTGWHIVTLSYRAGDPTHDLTARICPEGGSNLFSLQIGPIELLRQPDSLRQLQGRGYGMLVLYPTPNRVRYAQFTFQGNSYRMPTNWREHHLHGLVLDKPWQFAEPVVTDSSATLRTWIDFAPDTEPYRYFPWRSRLSLEFTLTAQGVRVSYTVENRDEKELPYGFAIHPYFNLLGERSQTFVHVPAQAHMEAIELLPTGNLEPLDGSPYDLRQPRPLSELNLDDVYWGMTPDRPMSWEARDKGIRLTLRASEVFTHAVVYTPPDRNFFCLENQTCSTDAHNLHERGLLKESHLLIVPPGKTSTGWVEIIPALIR
jgi:aldose 1-epimerase